LFGLTFPWGTLAVNVFGSLWLGFFGALAVAKPDAVDHNLRFLLTTGFAGGLTTFSSLAFETLGLYERGDTILAAANVGANVVLGMLFVWVGVLIARAI
jgi:CrcB protein